MEIGTKFWEYSSYDPTKLNTNRTTEYDNKTSRHFGKFNHPISPPKRKIRVMTFSLDAATKLTQLERNRFQLEVDSTWWNFESAFGGWAAATAFASVKAHEDHRGDLLSLNAVFPRAIKAGTIEVRTEILARRKQSDFWRIVLANQNQPEEVLVAFDIVMGKKRAPDEDSFQKRHPDAPDPTTLEVMEVTSMGPAWLQHYEQRAFVGTPFTRNARPLSCVWVCHKDNRPFDTKALITLSDTPMPRVFFTSNTPRFGSTISFSVSTTLTEKELSELRPMRVLVEADSRSVGRGSYDQLVNIWSECGTLLSVSNQTAVFR